MPPVYLEIDASDLNDEINRLKAVMTPERFERVMAGIYRRTGGHVRKILKQDLPQDYKIRPGEVGSAVKSAKMSMGAGGAGCSIPVEGPRRHIGGGGRGFPAFGHRRGWASLKGPYKVSAEIYRGSRSTLPSHMSSYHGYPPFRNIPSVLGGLTFTRTGVKKISARTGAWIDAVEPVMDIAIPQMPMNRSEPSVQEDIKTYMYNRMEHEFQRIIGGH